MPFYDMKCVKCEYEDIDVFIRIPEIGHYYCSECGGPTKVVFHPIALELFPAQWMEHIDNEPQYVESKKQLRAICDKNDLTCYYSIDGERGPHVKEV